MITKKIIILLALSTLIFVSVVPQTNASDELSLGILDSFRIFNFNTSLDIKASDSTYDEPLNINQSYPFTINIDFNYIQTNFFPSFLTDSKIEKWVLFRDANRNKTVNLSISITDAPDWVEATLFTNNFEIELSTDVQTFSPVLSFKIKPGTEAFLEDDIKIKAEFIPESNWGLLQSEDTFNFSIMSKFNKSVVLSGFSDNETEIITKPGKNILYPINITNNGNGITEVKIQSNNNDLKGWNISFEPELKNVAIGATEKIFLNITVPSKKDSYNQALNFTITSKSSTDKDIADAYLLEGSQSFSIDMKVEYEEEDDYLSNLLIVLVILIVILVIISIIIKLYKRKK